MFRKLVISYFLIFGCIGSYAQIRNWTLEECIEHVINNNIVLKQAELQVSNSEQEILSVKGNYYPDLAVGMGQSFSFGSSINGATNERVSRDILQTDIGLRSNIVIFNGFATLYAYKQAKLGFESSKLDLEKLQDDMRLNVINGYLNILFNKENLKVAQLQLDVTKEQLNVTKDLVEAGVSARSDLFNVEATLSQDLQGVVQAENSLDLSILQLAQLLQVPSSYFDIEEVEISVPSGSLMFEDAEFVYDRALEIRPEIKKAETDVQIADYSIKIARVAYLPSLSFQLDVSTFYNHAQGNPDVLYREEKVNGQPTGAIDIIDNRYLVQFDANKNYSLVFNLSIPIFNKLQTKTQVAKSIINRDLADLTLAEGKQALQITIEQAFLDTKLALRTYEAALQSLESQKEAFRNAQEKYNIGVFTTFEFNQARNNLFGAESQLISAKYDFVFKTKVLDFYMGNVITLD